MSDPSTSAEQLDTSIAERYVDAANAADLDAMLDLFADDAELFHPVGTYRGHTELAEFYTGVVFAGQAIITLIDTFAGHDSNGALCVSAQLSATSPLATDGAVSLAADVFCLGDDGRIARLDIYYR